MITHYSFQIKKVGSDLGVALAGFGIALDVFCEVGNRSHGDPFVVTESPMTEY